MASTARLDELKKKFDENPRRYFAPLANEHRKSGDLDQAISLCRAHLPLQPAHISGHIVLAQALFEAGTVDESREIFLAALGLDPENLIALRYLGDIAREASDVDTARGWYQRVLEVDPRNDEIVQLVRELDMPRPAVVAEADVAFEAPVEIETVTSVPSPQPAANNDARFEPLSMEEFDVGSDAPSADAGRQQAEDVAEPAKAEDSFDVHAAWSTESPSLDDAMLDTSDIDPFDLHPSASAESLFSGEADPAAADFLTELSGINAPDDGSDPASPYAMDVWTESTTEEVMAASTPPGGQGESFEEGLDLVTASTAPTVHAVPDEVFVSEAIGADMEPAQEPTPVEAHESVAMADPNAEALALFADSQTAEWQPPTSEVASTTQSPVADTLGLEVMEFVPPSSEAAQPSILEAPADTDPLLGRTPDLGFAEQESAPPVFVTETMAELYLQQGFRNEALDVYRELLARNPDDASLRDRIDKIESGSMSSLGVATLSEEVVESAMKRQAGRPARSVRSLFASLASRRAPVAPSQAHAAESSDVVVESPVTDYAPASEPVAAAESPMIAEPPADVPTVSVSERIAPLMSAAESLASFDPFADTSELLASAPEPEAPSLMHDPWADVTPTEAQSIAPDASLGEPRADYTPAPQVIEPVASIDPVPQRRTLEDLFPNAPVTARTEAAAQTFATAFGRDEPQGRPTRAANNELSLDHVFRGSADNTAVPDGGFSFDQFFSDARPAGGDVAAPTLSAPDIGGRSAGPGGDAHDIEQFTAWLEGLKKK